jgi:hypothetical protein
MFERITGEQVREQAGHVYRYHFAKGLIDPKDAVVDIASGVGYGAAILQSENYVGIDKIEPEDQFRSLGKFIHGVDLNNWEPDFDWDVTVSFETLEHLVDPERFADMLQRHTRDLIILSTPTRPTKHLNEFHLHDFTVDDVLDLFSERKLIHMEDQPSELSHIFVFGMS